MSSEQGTNNQIVLPSDIKRAEELAKNRISLLEEDGRRLTRFNQELERTCASQNEFVNKQKEEIKDNETKLSNLKSVVAQYEDLAKQADAKCAESKEKAVASLKDAKEIESIVKALLETREELKEKIQVLEKELKELDSVKQSRVNAVNRLVLSLESFKSQF